MIDAKAQLEKLRIDAVECDMIAKLATTKAKRETFAGLAESYRKMAADLEELIRSGKISGDLGI